MFRFPRQLRIGLATAAAAWVILATGQRISEAPPATGPVPDTLRTAQQTPAATPGIPSGPLPAPVVRLELE